MELKTIWQQGSNNPENPNYLATIREWWTNLQGQEIFWQQRIIPETSRVDDLDWEPQKFDELFAISNPDIRGITLYWHKPDSPQERNTTPEKLILDSLHQSLYIFPQTQKGLVIRVSLPTINYQTIQITNPKWEYQTSTEKYMLTLKDDWQKIEVKVTLNHENFKELIRLIIS
ncbi:MAG: hypothetical protein QNJ47_03210 [Nostocaceae cyanobacterium]|nr:hypothetical protein [Nostocaceae cyanobacterium]